MSNWDGPPPDYSSKRFKIALGLFILVVLGLFFWATITGGE